MNLHFTAIQKWETGVATPTVRHVFKLAKIYDVHPGALFFDPSGIHSKHFSDTLIVMAASLGVHPAALFLAGTDEERCERARQLTRCLSILDRVPQEWAELWLKLGELVPATVP
jgi:transcriptional regulator with XRE-family HTH domain